MTSQKSTKKYYFLYFILFIVMCFAAFYPFIAEGKSFIWAAGVEDGLTQHFESLAYWGHYLREAVKSILSGHPSFPMWNMSLGYGGDILSTLNYYAIGDPLNLLYIFVPMKQTESMYTFMILLRMFLAGTAFMAYCRKMNKNHFASVMGALVYVFCGFIFRSGLRHPFFINPMIYFPLLCLGVEKIYKKERPYLFIAVTAVASMSNFYFLYMLTIFTVIYALIRFYQYYSKDKLKNFFVLLRRFAGYYILGVALSAVILLPAVYGFLGNGRGGGQVHNLIAYPFKYYILFLENFVGYGNSGQSTNVGFIPIAGIVVLFLMYSRRMKHKKYKMAFLGCIIFLALPVFGFIFNGFSYVTNRWNFVFTFIIALLVSEMYPRLFYMSKRQIIGILIGISIYNLIIRVAELSKPEVFKNDGAYIAGIFLFLFYLVLLYFQWKGMDSKSMATRIVISVLVVISIGVHGFYRFGDGGRNYISEFLDKGEAIKLLSSDENKQLKKQAGSQMVRVHNETQRFHNYGVLDELNTVSAYYSIIPKETMETVRSYETLGMQYADKYHGVDLRQGLLSLASVKYIMVPETESLKGCRLLHESEGIRLYENPYALPFGYTYDSWISQKDYDSMNGAEREQAMIKSAVLDEGVQDLKKQDSSSVQTAQKKLSGRKSLSVNRGGRTEKYRLKLDSNKENYIYIKNLRYSPLTKNKSNMSDIALKGKKGNKGIDVMDGSNEKHIYIQDKMSSYYFGRHDYLMKISGDGDFEVNFLSSGTYSLESVSLITVNPVTMQKELKKRKRNSLKNIIYKDNVFSGEIETKKTKLLCIPIAYSKGWSAKVDGKKAEILKTNGMYMGVVLKPGKHKITLDYRTPWLIPGVVISITAGMIFLIYIVVSRRKRRRV
ncbi:YfhO family protein [Anaerostipes sp.]|uniref:YfhO family protein n=1 Tax=Anaerostipes sp. TaxID=1872530 RepID=UPI0025B9C47C|nr:YfhO family protein [Anaerostipes sp.]MBS7007106.1 YfhO family protein [Anaerostipes sp.]